MYIVYIVYREHVRRMCENLCVWGGGGWEAYVYEGWNPSVKTRTHTSEVVGKTENKENVQNRAHVQGRVLKWRKL